MKLKCPLCKSEKLNAIAIGDDPENYFLCSVCSLKFLNPALRLDEDSERERYLLHNNDVEDVGYQKFVQPLFEEITKLIPAPAHGLDFGAGAGPVLAKKLEQNGYQVSLYDPFFWPDRSVLTSKYDFIFACEVVEHLFEPSHEFSQLRGMLKPGGLLALKTHFYGEANDFEKWYYRQDPTHVCFYNLESFQWIADNHDFSKMQVVGDRIALLTV